MSPVQTKFSYYNLLLVFPQLDIMYCNCNICHYVLYRGLWPPGTVHHTIKSLRIDLLIHIFGWYADVLWAHATVTITSVIVCCIEICGHLVMSFTTIKSLHKDLILHISGWYTDFLWVQLVHSFDQVVGRVLLCGHLIIQTVSIHHYRNTHQISKFLPGTIRCPMRFIECLPYENLALPKEEGGWENFLQLTE